MEAPLKYLQPDVISKLANMELRARLVVEGFITGLHKSPYHGFSVEFAEHRQYMPGDEIRRLDWKVYGKTDRYYIKQYEEETNLSSTLVLDASNSMSFASDLDGKKKTPRIPKLVYASYVAAALSYLMVQQRDAVGLTIYDEGIRTAVPPHATQAHLRRVLRELEVVKAGSGTGTAASLHRIAEQTQRRGLVIVLSDLFDDQAQVLAALKHFRHNHHEVLVLQILDPLERSFAFGGDAVFKDLETDEEMMSQPYHLQRSYQKEMQSFLERYKRECRENSIDYVMMDTATPFDTALFQYLIKRRRMG
ncbi:MAG: DUF58 domain-containing protein [Ignavibacteriales bacterium]|nr:DUF58 domain-containing protein [Ignavibacteriales bacterium]